MTRFFGKVGYVTEVREGGVSRTVATERSLKGDVKRNLRYFRTGDSVTGEKSMQTRIEVIADAYALENSDDIQYVVLAGRAWTVDSVDPEHPRLILSLGGRYTGDRSEDSND
jgi:hypothetical protein